MSKIYTFECYDDEDKTTTRVEFETESPCWSGFDGPVWKFFDFLKGCGYVFDIEAQLGILDKNGSFTGSADE